MDGAGKCLDLLCGGPPTVLCFEEPESGADSPCIWLRVSPAASRAQSLVDRMLVPMPGPTPGGFTRKLTMPSALCSVYTCLSVYLDTRGSLARLVKGSPPAHNPALSCSCSCLIAFSRETSSLSFCHAAGRTTIPSIRRCAGWLACALSLGCFRLLIRPLARIVVEVGRGDRLPLAVLEFPHAVGHQPQCRPLLEQNGTEAPRLHDVEERPCPPMAGQTGWSWPRLHREDGVEGVQDPCSSKSQLTPPSHWGQTSWDLRQSLAMPVGGPPPQSAVNSNESRRATPAPATGDGTTMRLRGCSPTRWWGRRLWIE